MYRDKNKRFGYHAIITVKDRLDGSTAVVNISVDKNKKQDIVGSLEHELKDIYYKIAKTFPDKLSKKDIQDKITYLKQNKKWGNKRIENWFAKFGIEVTLPKQGRLKKGQTILS